MHFFWGGEVFIFTDQRETSRVTIIGVDVIVLYKLGVRVQSVCLRFWLFTRNIISNNALMFAGREKTKTRSWGLRWEDFT
jgi:hypothetical protein